jgi:Zn2+/Cd2+-exporting ATPase
MAGASKPSDDHVSLFTPKRRREAARIVVVGILTLLYWRSVVAFPILLGALAVGLYPLAKTGLLDLWHERKIGTELFVTIATLIAVTGGEYVAGSVLMTIILIAEYIADLNTDRARASIKALIGAAPRTATIRTPDGERILPIDELTAGAVVLVRAGEKIPVDGTVLTGSAAVNEGSITGESLPVEKGPESSVLAGTVVDSGALDIRTDKIGTDTLFAQIVALVEKAESEAAPVQKLADRVAAWLLPLVLVFLVTVFLLTRDIRKIVTLLIFTSPAELGLATPMVMIAAIARAARHGILVKGGLYLERLAKADAFVFDKTGTLTYGEPEVVGVAVHDRALTEGDLLRYAAAADLRSAHPLAKAVVKAARERGLQIPDVQDFRTIHGRGVIGIVDAREVMVGNEALLTEHAVVLRSAEEPHPGSTVHVAVNGQLAGSLHFEDQIKTGTAAVMTQLRRAGVKRIVMLTGDNAESATAVAGAIGITDIRADLLPEDKIKAVEALQREGLVVAMVGDGVNDAPALARADVGIAMGARGSQAAIEAADIALMTDDLQKIVTARLLARRAYRTIKENLFVGVGVVHVLGIIAALQGWIGPIQAALLHLGPDVLVFLNSVKLLRVRLEGSN